MRIVDDIATLKINYIFSILMCNINANSLSYDYFLWKATELICCPTLRLFSPFMYAEQFSYVLG